MSRDDTHGRQRDRERAARATPRIHRLLEPACVGPMEQPQPGQALTNGGPGNTLEND